MNRWRWLFGLAALLAAGSTAEARTQIIHLAAGPVDGMHHALAEKAARQLSSPDFQVDVLSTSGTADNLDRLIAGSVDFGFVPQDFLIEEIHQHRADDLAVIDRVFFDDLHILLRNPVQVTSVSDLLHLRIWAGEERATRFSAQRFFDSLGDPAPDHLLNISSMDVGLVRLRQELEAKGLDAAILVATPGSRSICNLLASSQASLLSLDRPTLRRLTLENKDRTNFLRQIAITRLSPGIYPISEPVTTIAIPVLLVARKDADATIATALRNAIIQQRKELARSHDLKGCRLPEKDPPTEPLGVSGLPLLKNVQPAPQSFNVRLLALGSGLIAAILAPVFFIGSVRGKRYRRQAAHLFHNAWSHYRWIACSYLALVVGVVLVTVLTIYTEGEINDNFSSPTEALWSITVFLFSGLEDRVPFTLGGRIGVTAALFLSGIFALLTSALITKEILMSTKKMPLGTEGHFLILNWNERLGELVHELLQSLVKEGTRIPIVVLTDVKDLTVEDVTSLGDDNDGFMNVYVKAGDPTQERSLLQVNAAKARCILILAGDDSADERTLRSVLMLRKIAHATGRDDLHVVAELADSASAPGFAELATDFPGFLEQVTGLRVRTCLLVQAALNKGIAAFYTDLLSIADHSNEVYTQEVPAQIVEKNFHFRDYAAHVLRQEGDPLIPVGIQRIEHGKPIVHINPGRKDASGSLKEGDRLVLIGWRPPHQPLPVPAE